jgi:hypothetical protein
MGLVRPAGHRNAGRPMLPHQLLQRESIVPWRSMPIQNRDFSHVVQFMSHRNRWGVLERAGQLYNLRSAARIVPLLCSMSAKGAGAQRSSQSGVCHSLDIAAVLRHHSRRGDCSMPLLGLLTTCPSVISAPWAALMYFGRRPSRHRLLLPAGNGAAV